jgi:uncharacterized protein
MIFIDTGAFLGRYIARDQCHKRALRVWKQLEKRSDRCVTSNFVLDETLTLLARRATYAFAAERGRLLFASRALVILRPTAEQELAALDVFEKYADQGISFTDAISFVLMQEGGIRRVFSFDRHFDLPGFDRVE